VFPLNTVWGGSRDWVVDVHGPVTFDLAAFARKLAP